MEKSFQEKLCYAEKLADKICFNGSSPKDTDMYGKEISDLLWAYVDGLMAKFLMNRINGQCSLKAFMEFDMEEEEKKLDKHIEQFEKIIMEG